MMAMVARQLLFDFFHHTLLLMFLVLFSSWTGGCGVYLSGLSMLFLVLPAS
jgi:hypothetical protein